MELNTEIMPPEIQIFGALCQISNRLEIIGKNFLEELTTKQWFFMAFLSNLTENPPTLTEMADLMGCSHQNIKQIALKLEKKGFIELKKNKTDGRSLKIIFTKKAEKYGKTFDKKGHNFLKVLFQKFNYNEIMNLKDYMNRLLNTVTEMQISKNYTKIEKIKNEVSEK